MEGIRKIVSEGRTSGGTNSTKEFQAGLIGLQKSFSSRLDAVKISVQSIDISISQIKSSINSRSKSQETDMEGLRSSNKQIQEAVTEVSNDVCRTRDTISDIEKSITALSESDEFKQPRNPVRQKNMISVDEVSISAPVLLQIDDDDNNGDNDDDPEIAFAKVTARDTNSKQDKEGDMSKTDKPKGDSQDETRHVDDDASKKSDSRARPRSQKHTDNRSTRRGKPKICLIGDSIAGQVSASFSGKSTNTFVQKLKAPKLKDIENYTTQVQDAKMVIVHCGVINLRDTETTSSIVKRLTESITSLKEALPEIKIAISKPTPVGERKFETGRNIFNAEAEK